jgi:transposase
MPAIEVKVSGNREVLDVIGGIIERGRNLRPVLALIGARMVERTKQRFDTLTGPDGQPWAPKHRFDPGTVSGQLRGIAQKGRFAFQEGAGAQGGQASGLDSADVLLKDINAQTVIADKGYDAQQRVVEPLLKSGKAVVIPSICTRKVQRSYDKHLYKARHLIENFFARLKQYRAIATRYDKTAAAFLGAIHLAASVIWLI